MNLRFFEGLLQAIPQMGCKRILPLALCGLLAFSPSFAQSSAETKREFAYPQKVQPQQLDNYQFTVYFIGGKKVYNLRGLELCNAGAELEQLTINPSGTSFAVLGKKGNKSVLSVYDLWTAGKRMAEYKDIDQATAITYTPDAQQLLVANSGKILAYDARKHEKVGEFEISGTPSQLYISPNGYHLLAVEGPNVTIYNLESKEPMKEIEMDAPITDIDFSKDGTAVAILSADGLLSTYDTRSYFPMLSIDGLGDALSCSYNPDSKWVSVVTGDGRIAVINMFDPQDREYWDISDGGCSDAIFLKDGKEQVFLAYNTKGSIVYRLMSDLAPNLTKLLSDELNERMNEWMKMLPGETLEEYNLRVNDETRKQQARLFEEEIATRMAENLFAETTVSLGNYNTAEGRLAINFDTLPTIYLPVPENELNDFMDVGNLEFTNLRYGLTADDKFELVYADVLNKKSGNTYTFDNRDRKSLDYLMSDDSYVPLELVQMSNLEGIKLNEIKDNIMALAKQQSQLSDHTNIDVDARVVTDYDAQGNKILNYKIDFAYTVDKEFSAQEDFAPGKYKVEESPAAQSMLAIIKTAFDSEFARYVKPGKKVRVNVTGMADALPINRTLAYDGSYGDFSNEPVYKNGQLSNISVSKASGITENEQLAFVRGQGVRNFIAKEVLDGKNMQPNYVNYIEVTEGTGGEFRRIKVEFLFIDAF
ncbi:MAG: WD40 repeat domain-containing protein [Bacteroidales bacterium]|nr:WD40 repeat domain-containing protein [Bacteroidales bacterium]